MDYKRVETVEFVTKIKALGFRVFVAKDGEGTYGFITDDTEARVLSFSCDGPWSSLSGNYGPPSRESGTGWQLDKVPGNLHTAADVRETLYAMPPAVAGKGWRHLTTLAQYLAMYGSSSKYKEV